MAEGVVRPSISLVKFDNPVLVKKHSEKKHDAKLQLGKPSLAAGALPSLLPLCPKSAQLITNEQREILNSIQPPREWEEGGQLWRQQVSSTPATRVDVLNLHEQFDMRLQQRQAREMGICPVRRELYTQCFDEVIRQVTINCAELGQLLLRIRDEIRMTISAYQTLYESSIAFGIRKALMAEQGKADLEATVAKLQSEKSCLQNKIVELQSHAEQMERRFNEQKLAEDRKHTEQIQCLMKTNQQLKAQLEGIVAPKK